MKNLLKVAIIVMAMSTLFVTGCGKRGTKTADTRKPANETVYDDDEYYEEDEYYEGEGDFTLTNFIGAWAPDGNEDMVLIIDQYYNWQDSVDIIYSTGTLEADYGSAVLYTSEGNYYCTLTYDEGCLYDEYDNVYTYAGPADIYIADGEVILGSEFDEYYEDQMLTSSIIDGIYYIDDEYGDTYIEITNGTEYAMWVYSEDGWVILDEGYLEAIDDIGHYMAYPTLYEGEEPYEIFQFDTTVLDWNGYTYILEE